MDPNPTDMDNYLNLDALRLSERDLNTLVNIIRSRRTVPYRPKAKAAPEPVVLPPALEAIVTPPAKPTFRRRF